MHPPHRAKKYPRGKYQNVDLTTLQFATGKNTERYLQLRKCFKERTDDPSWMHMEPNLAGNFVGEYWTRGPNNEHILHGVGGGWKEKPGLEWYELGVLTYGLPAVFGLTMNAGRNPGTEKTLRAEGWGVEFSYADMDLMGSMSASITFPKWEKGKIVDRLRFLEPFYTLPEGFIFYSEDSRNSSQVESDRITIPFEGDIDGKLISILKSERSFRKHALSSNKKLQREFRKNFSKHRIKKQIFEEYKNDGIPPEYTLEDLEPRGKDERWLLFSELKGIHTTWEEIKDRSAQLYELLMRLASFHEIWKKD